MSRRNLPENSGDRAALDGMLIGLGAAYLGAGETMTTAAVAAGLAARNIGAEWARNKNQWYEVIISAASAAVILGRMDAENLSKVWMTAIRASETAVRSLPFPAEQAEAAGKLYGWMAEMPPAGVAAILGLVIAGPPLVRIASRKFTGGSNHSND